MNKTTQNHWRLFKKEFDHWGKVFGFNQYDIMHEWNVVDINARSTVITQSDPTSFIVLFCKYWHDSPVNDYEVAKVAFHEALEIVFEPLESFTGKKNKKLAEKERHKLINLFTALVFEPYWKKR